VPIFLGRRPEEPADEQLTRFYRELLAAVGRPAFRNGRWQLCTSSGWAGNPGYQNILAWCWVDGDERFLIIVNLSAHAAEAHVQVPWDDLRGRTWRLVDSLSGEVFERSGDDMREGRLYIALRPWGVHFLGLGQ
jgi:hypothetical protein